MSSSTSHDRFRIVGGASLKGEVTVTGAKNSVLKLMAASLLAVGKTTISNVPDIADVDIMSDLLTRLGCTVVLNNKAGGDGTVTIDVPETPLHRADYELVRKMRASITYLVHLLLVSESPKSHSLVATPSVLVVSTSISRGLNHSAQRRISNMDMSSLKLHRDLPVQM